LENVLGKFSKIWPLITVWCSLSTIVRAVSATNPVQLGLCVDVWNACESVTAKSFRHLRHICQLDDWTTHPRLGLQRPWLSQHQTHQSST